MDFTPELTRELVDLAEKYQFLLFEDRKFADIGKHVHDALFFSFLFHFLVLILILLLLLLLLLCLGNTVVHQYRDGMYHISSWAHIINCHPIPGPGIVQGLAKVGTELGRGLLLISDMSSKGWLGDMDYRKACLDMATAFPDFVVGWISGSRWHDALPGVVMTPGISLESAGDALGQQYKSPAKAIGELGSDIIIVGRSIIEAADPAHAAQTYQKVGWDAYLGTLD